MAKKKKKKSVRTDFFRGEPCAVTFHESNLNGVHYEKACFTYFRLQLDIID